MQNLAFIDVETTGLSPSRDRIIEIGIVRVERGRVVQRYNQLVNPNMYIHPMIQSITGIHPDKLSGAPSFDQLSEEVYRLLSNATFVAHNARFDYSFIRSEFKRLNKTFRSPQLCTAKLSRRLYPRYRRHGLSHIISRFNLTCENRHRAYDDAHALWQFYQVIENTFPHEKIELVAKTVQKRPSLPPLLNQSAIDELPETTGVYFFYDRNNTLLYIGKAKNIRSRVLSHFSADNTSSKQLAMCRQIARIEYSITAGELGALLRESYLVKALNPIYNRVLRYKKKLIVARSWQVERYKTVKLEEMKDIQASDLESVVGVFKSKKQALLKLSEIAETHQLCKKLLGTEKTKSACFGYHLGTCRGACLKKESHKKYNLRFLLARAENRLKPWLFKSSVEIVEKNNEEKIRERFVIDQWCLLQHKEENRFGPNYDDTYNPQTPLPTGYTLDLDTYHILNQYLRKNYLSGKSSTTITINESRTNTAMI